MKRIIILTILCFAASTLFAGTGTVSIKDSVFVRSAKLYYPSGVTENVTSYMDNAKIISMLSTLSKDNFSVESIKISGWSSPEGRTSLNQSLSEQRAASLKSILQGMFNFPESVYSTKGNGEDWNGLKELCSNSNYALVKLYSKEINKAFGLENNDKRKEALKTIGGGQLYSYFTKELFPKLRYADCEMVFRVEKITKEEAENLDIVVSEPVNEQPEPVVEQPAHEPVVEQPAVEQHAGEVEALEPIVTDWGKWRVSLAAGPHAFLGSNDVRMNKSDLVKIGIQANVERWFNDYIGVGFSMTAARIHGLYSSINILKGDDPRWRQPENIYCGGRTIKYYQQKTWMFNPAVYAVTNLTNDFGGTRQGGRIFNLLLSAGCGVPFAHSSYHDSTYAGFSMNTSLINSLRVAEHLDLLLMFNGSAINKTFDGERNEGYLFDATASVMCGLAWRF